MQSFIVSTFDDEEQQEKGHTEAWHQKHTLFPTINVSPSGAQAKLNASPSPLTSLKQALVLTSQNLTTPSVLTLHSSASLVGLKATFSTDAV